MIEKVHFNLSRQTSEQRLARIPRQLQQPVVKHSCLVFVAHFELVILQYLYEVTHDVGEEGYSTKHDDDGQNPLKTTYWIEITVAHSTERGQGVVTTDY